jgi:hypothetical protein
VIIRSTRATLNEDEHCPSARTTHLVPEQVGAKSGGTVGRHGSTSREAVHADDIVLPVAFIATGDVASLRAADRSPALVSKRPKIAV